MHNESRENLVYKYIRFSCCFLMLHGLVLAHSNGKVGSDVSTSVHTNGLAWRQAQTRNFKL